MVPVYALHIHDFSAILHLKIYLKYQLHILYMIVSIFFVAQLYLKKTVAYFLMIMIKL